MDRNGARLVGHRKAGEYCSGGDGDEDVLTLVLRALSDCHAVLVAKIGRCPRSQLAAAGIEPVTDRAFQPIEPSLLGWLGALADRIAAGAASAPEPRPPLEAGAPGPAATRVA